MPDTSYIYEFVKRINCYGLGCYSTHYYRPYGYFGEAWSAQRIEDLLAAAMSSGPPNYGFMCGIGYIWAHRKITAAAGPSGWVFTQRPVTLPRTVNGTFPPLISQRIGRKADGDARNFQGVYYLTGLQIADGIWNSFGEYGGTTSWLLAGGYDFTWTNTNGGHFGSVPVCVCYSRKLNEWRDTTQYRLYGTMGVQRRRRLPHGTSTMFPS